MMKENKLRRILNEGKGSVSTRIWSPWATMMEAAASTGIFDYLEFVAEYSPYDLMLMENMARACELHDTGSMIKVDFQNRFYVAQKAMAAGFQAILFTDHKTPEEVEESIYMTMPDCPEYKGRFGFPNNRWIGFNGYVPQLDYAKMCAVCDHVRAGLPWIATHPDFNCPTETGFIPDAGAIHAFIHASTGRMPDLVIGKPNRGISDYLLERVGSDMGGEKLLPSQIAMVGDRLYTDIAAGNRAGFVSIFVLSGEASLEDAQRAVAEGNEEQIPDLIFPSVAEIPI